ncbi:hypothetical protein ACJX0J_028623, partial [Zea mays]
MHPWSNVWPVLWNLGRNCLQGLINWNIHYNRIFMDAEMEIFMQRKLIEVKAAGPCTIVCMYDNPKFFSNHFSIYTKAYKEI